MLLEQFNYAKCKMWCMTYPPSLSLLEAASLWFWFMCDCLMSCCVTLSCYVVLSCSFIMLGYLVPLLLTPQCIFFQ